MSRKYAHALRHSNPPSGPIALPPTSPSSAIISHGDPFCFERAGLSSAFERMAAQIPMLRGYTDAFGHAMVLGGGVGAMVDCDLNPWDTAATQLLVPEAGGRCEATRQANGQTRLVIGSPPLVDQLLEIIDETG